MLGDIGIRKKILDYAEFHGYEGALKVGQTHPDYDYYIVSEGICLLPDILAFIDMAKYLWSDVRAQMTPSAISGELQLTAGWKLYRAKLLEVYDDGHSLVLFVWSNLLITDEVICDTRKQ